MSVKHLITSLLRSREAYEAIADKLEESDFSEQENLLLRNIQAYYGRDSEARCVDPALLLESICRELPNPKHRDTFKTLVEELFAIETSPANVVANYIAVRRDRVGNRLASALAAGKPVEEIVPLFAEYGEWIDKELLDSDDEEGVVVGVPVLELVRNRLRSGSLIRIAPTTLNERLDGGLLRGQHMVVFARPEVGKTAFLINAIIGFLRQGLRVLFIGNEDPLEDIILRVICRLTERTKHEVLENPEAAGEAAVAAGYNNVVFASLAPGTPAQIERLVTEYTPDVVIVDQLRNIRTSRPDNVTQRLEEAASAVRQIGKRHKCAMISTTQAGDSATDKSILTMGDVDSSNTGIPAQADVLLGIGMDSRDEARGMRWLALCKNKCSGNHSHFAVRFDAQTSHFYSN